VKCNGERPCTACTAAMCSIECSDSDSLSIEEISGDRAGSVKEVALVENPCVPISRSTQRWTVVPRPPDPRDTDMNAQNFLLRLIWGLGYDPRVVARILRLVTPSLKFALDSLEKNIKLQASKLFTSSSPLDMKGHWDDSERVGQVSFGFNGAGLMDSIALNGVMQNHWGAHPEEVAARMSSREVPLPSSEYRVLCMLLDGLFGLPQKMSSRIFCAIPAYVSLESQATPISELKYIIVRVTSTKHYDDSGRIFASSSTAVQLSAEEYEAARKGSDVATGHFVECERSGAELEHGKGLVEEESIERMIQCEEGRSKLDRLADRIMQKFRLAESQQGAREEVERASEGEGAGKGVQGGEGSECLGLKGKGQDVPSSNGQDVQTPMARNWMVWSMRSGT